MIDCGAHVGVFTRYALSRGAKRVVAIEPEPGNIACLEANFSKEIAAGDVILVKAGVWDRRSTLRLTDRSLIRRRDFAFSQGWSLRSRRSTLRLTLSRDHSGANRFESHHGDHAEASFVEDVPVLPLDDLVQEIRLDRVDFIKMDIEGAEQRALKGAAQTIQRFRPRMAICTYHNADDPQLIPKIIREVRADYTVRGRDIETQWFRRVSPKVLFFH